MFGYPYARSLLQTIDWKLSNRNSMRLTRFLAVVHLFFLSLLLVGVGGFVILTVQATSDGLDVVKNKGSQTNEQTYHGSTNFGFFEDTTKVKNIPLVLVMFWSLTLFFAFSVFIQINSAYKLLQATRPDLPFTQKLIYIDFWSNVNIVFCIIEFLFNFVLMSDYLFGMSCIALRALGFIIVAIYLHSIAKENLSRNSTEADDKTPCKV